MSFTISVCIVWSPYANPFSHKDQQHLLQQWQFTMVSPNLSDKNQLMFETFIVLEGENHKSSRIPPSILSFLPSLALNWGSTINKPKNPPKWHRKPTFKRRCCHRNYSIEHPSSSMDVASRVVGILTLTSPYTCLMQ